VVTDLNVQALAVAAVAVMIGAAALWLFRYRSAAASLNGVIAVMLLALQAPGLIGYLWNPDAYIRQYGTAALSELPLLVTGVGLALVALAASALSVAWRPLLFWLGWLANLPTATLLLYLAFWFHIF
jgi:hypothetical protein